MKTLADLIIRNRGIVISLLVLLTLFLGYKASKIGLNADFSTYLQQDNPLVQQFNRIGEVFAGKSVAMVLIESENLFSTETLTLIRDLTNAYEDMDGVAYVTSLTNVLDFKKIEGGLEVGKLIQRGEIPQAKEELKGLRDYVMSKEMYVGDLVSEDGKATIIILRLTHGVNEPDVVKELRWITEDIAPSNRNISFGGMPALMDSMILLISENMNILLPIMAGIIFLVLILAFRKPGGIFLPLTIVLMAIIFTMGLMVVFGLSVDMISGIMPVILVAMGSADGIHFMKRYYERRRIGEIPKVAARETFAEMWVPFVITTVTTMVGFVSLVISEFSVISQFGLVTALGLFLALLITFTLLPTVLSFSRGKVTASKKVVAKTSNRFLERVGDVIYKNKILVLISAAVIVVLSVVAIPKIVKDVDWSLCLQKGSKPHRAEMLLREKFGGSLPVQVLVNGDIKDPATLKSMRFIERYLNTVPLVSESQSIASVISEMNYVMNDRYTVPETRDGVANLWLLIEDEDIIEQMVTSDNREALIQGKMATMATQPLVLAVEEIDQLIQRLPKSLAVFDLREVPPQKREAFLKIRQKNISDKIFLDFKQKGIDVDRNKIEELITTALFKKEIEDEAYVLLEKKTVDYLLSNEAEVEVTSKPGAEAIARKVIEKFRKGMGILPEQITNIVKSEVKGVDDENVEYLSESLNAVVSETIGEIKVASVLQELKGILPPGSEKIRDLNRDLKGDLWEMNESLMVMNMDEYQEISGGSNPPKPQELRVLMKQTGLAPVLMRMEAALTPSQVYSILIALVFVIFMLALMLRSVVGGIISVVPICITILVNFAVMSYIGIGLDSFTSMIASIAIGLGIDYAVHFNSRYRHELSELKDELLALKRTLGTTGVAIIINTLTVGLGYSVLLLAGGQHVQRFGGLTALTMFSSAIFTLTVLPSLSLLLKPKYLRKEIDINKRKQEDSKMKPILFLTLLGLLVVGLTSSAQGSDLTGEEILAKVDAVINAPKDMVAVQKMTLIDSDGSTKEREVKIYQKGKEWRLVRFLSPADVRSVSFLRLAEDRMYLYMPAFRKVRRIASSIKNNNFMGTDFSYEDMSETEYGKNYSARLLRQKETSYILELIPKPGADVSYGKLVMEVNEDNYVYTKIDYYSPAGKLVKMLQVENIEKIEGYWYGKKWEMKTIKDNHKTVLNLSEIKFNQNLSDNIFTQRNLKKTE